MTQRFEGKTVIVTGAAGGIGRATVEHLAREGAQIVAVDLKQSQLDEALSLATGVGAEAIAVGADVSLESDVRRYVDEAVTRFGGVDALFNNAGIEGVMVPLEEYPVEEFEKVMAVNVTGVFLGIKHVIPALRARSASLVILADQTSAATPLGSVITALSNLNEFADDVVIASTFEAAYRSLEKPSGELHA